MNSFGNAPRSNDAESIKTSISNKLVYSVGKDPLTAHAEDWLRAAELAVRDRLVERWMKTNRAYDQQDPKRVYYLSMEFLMGRTFTNALLALGIYNEMRAALAALQVDMEEIINVEPDAALGNGGLGRLAACFLDSMATLGITGMGYGIRYDYGMFSQQIVDGMQIESPDYWLAGGNPWEFPRPEVQYRVRFGGHIEEIDGKPTWVGSHDVLATAYDTIIPGYATETANTLRLWSAKATAEMDLSAFNEGNYLGAVAQKNNSENVTRVLYPDDSTLSGRQLRLHQEYFFVSASLQDLIRRYLRKHDNFDKLADSVAIHLNDTHPVLAIPELLRILLDEHHQDWEYSWRLAQRIFSYTNHTLMAEALETWPVDMLSAVLPRHLNIIFLINAEFLAGVNEENGFDIERMRMLSLIEEGGERRVRMAHLAVVASHKINGVSKLHSELLRQSLFREFDKIFPERFTNITNGITPRRWLSQANPALSALLDTKIGPDWRRDLSRLSALHEFAGDPAFVDAFRNAKQQNKLRLSRWIEDHLHVVVNTTSLFDVQVKRFHEYKRQLLNLLHVITRYNRIIDNPASVYVKRTVIFSGKAASAYHMAKNIIRLINDVAHTINNDPRVGDRLKVVFIPNYSVSLAELIIPAADLSEQISLAGTEASGTGNMKLSLNGALTIGTLDGANVEIQEQVGSENMFIFGKTTEEVAHIRAYGYQPRLLYEADTELKQVLDQIRHGRFSPEEPSRFHGIFDELVSFGDRYLLLADYASYIATQDRIDEEYRQSESWHRKVIANVAGMGMFSSDRTIADYAEDIWRVKTLE
ncbi:MAG: glycogen phosphorylase [Herbaspirillum sp.]|nr:glycogen phosphorylase [Herbaspirillum sp.]